MPGDPKTEWKAAYKAQQNESWIKLCDELYKERNGLLRRLHHESSWNHPSRIAWLTSLSRQLVKDSSSYKQGNELNGSLDNVIKPLNTLYHELPFYKRWWWYFRYRWWRVNEIAVASRVLSELQEDTLKQEQYPQLKLFMERTLKQISRWNWLHKVVKTMEAKIDQRKIIELKPPILTQLEKVWEQGLKELKEYGNKTFIHGDSFLGITTNREMVNKLNLTEIKTCEDKRHELAKTAIEKSSADKYSWLGGGCQDQQLAQTRELVYYRLLEDCLQQLLVKQAKYWTQVDNYRKQEAKDTLDISVMQDVLAELYESWHDEMMRCLSLCREGFCIATASFATDGMSYIYRTAVKEVIQLLNTNDKTMDNKWGGVLVMMKNRLEAIVAYEEWLYGDESSQEILKLDEGITLIHFIKQVNSLDKILKNEEGDPELRQALIDKAEALKEYDLSKLCLLGISRGTFDIPDKKLINEMNGLVEGYIKSVKESNQSIIKATVDVQENTPAERYEITTGLMATLRIKDELLCHWLRTTGGEEEEQIKQDFIRKLQHIERLNQELKKAQDESASKNILGELRECYKNYARKYHPDKIRDILKEEIAVSMFKTFSQNLEQRTNDYTSQISTNDPYFEEIKRLLEELIGLIKSSSDEYQKATKFCKEQTKEIGALIEVVQGLRQEVKAMQANENQPDLSKTQEPMIAVNKNESKAPVSMNFNNNYDPNFWGNPKVESSDKNTIPDSKGQVLI
ncbi:MAG TPA: hypothetical protein PK657_11155 [Legionella sp.]|nr:hypothetical protein [Legionella sp.]